AVELDKFPFLGRELSESLDRQRQEAKPLPKLLIVRSCDDILARVDDQSLALANEFAKLVQKIRRQGIAALEVALQGDVDEDAQVLLGQQSRRRQARSNNPRLQVVGGALAVLDGGQGVLHQIT